MGLRDITVLTFVLACIFLALRKPWWGVLSLAVFSYLNPHAYAWGFVRYLPLYQVLFIVVAISTLTTKDKQPIPNDWRIPAFFFLWIYFFLTSMQAYFPQMAWSKLWFVSKVYLPFIFTLLLINTREKLFYLIATIGVSIGIVAAKGGVFAILTGFGHRVYGPPATQFYENNAFAIAVLMAIPMLLILFREATNKWIRYAVMAAIPLCFASALSSWSRGGLLSTAILVLVLIWHSKRKYLVLPLLLAGIVLVAPMLPEEWYDRMYTIETFEEDASAMGRIETWKDGWEHTLSHPFTGAGFEGWRWVSRRDWHNSFVEMFAEHGFIAFGVWFTLIAGTLITLTRLPRQTRGIPGMEWVANYSYMIRASLLVYSAGTAFLGLAYWDLLYHLIFITVLIKQFALRELEKSETTAPGPRNPLAQKSNRPNTRKGVGTRQLNRPT
jgi:probable O-glycosylation ligase (exosortase A-associated)